MGAVASKKNLSMYLAVYAATSGNMVAASGNRRDTPGATSGYGGDMEPSYKPNINSQNEGIRSSRWKRRVPDQNQGIMTNQSVQSRAEGVTVNQSAEASAPPRDSYGEQPGQSTHNVMFYPGWIGLTHFRGEITEVYETQSSQGYQQGVQKGWRIVAVDGTSANNGMHADKLLRDVQCWSNIKQKSFQVTFSTTPASQALAGSDHAYTRRMEARLPQAVPVPTEEPEPEPGFSCQGGKSVDIDEYGNVNVQSNKTMKVTGTIKGNLNFQDQTIGQNNTFCSCM